MSRQRLPKEIDPFAHDESFLPVRTGRRRTVAFVLGEDGMSTASAGSMADSGIPDEDRPFTRGGRGSLFDHLDVDDDY